MTYEQSQDGRADRLERAESLLNPTQGNLWNEAHSLVTPSTSNARGQSAIHDQHLNSDLLFSTASQHPWLQPQVQKFQPNMSFNQPQISPLRMDDHGNQLPSRHLSPPAFMVWENNTRPTAPSRSWTQYSNTIGPVRSEIVPSTVQPSGLAQNKNAVEAPKEVNEYDKSTFNRLSQEVYVLSTGLIHGIGDGAREAASDPLGSSLRLGSAVLGGMAIAKLGTIAPLMAKAVITGGGIAMVGDIVSDPQSKQKWTDFNAACGDAWSPRANLSDDTTKISSSVGRLAFDTALLSAAAALTGASWKRVSNLEKPIENGATGSLSIDYGNKLASFEQNNCDAKFTFGGKVLHQWSGADVPSPETALTPDGVKITKIGTHLRIEEKPDQFIKIQHPEGTSEMHFKSGLRVDEVKQRGLYNERTLTYPSGLSVRQFADGRMHFEKNGTGIFATDSKGDIFDPTENANVWKTKSIGLPTLPKSPTVSEYKDEEVLSFPANVHLHMYDNGEAMLASGKSLKKFPC